MISGNNLSESEADGNQLKEISDLFVHAINTIVTMTKAQSRSFNIQLLKVN